MNFWGYLMQGVVSVLAVVVERLPMGLNNSVFTSITASLPFAMGPILLMREFVNMRLLAVSLVVIVSLTGAKAVIALIRWIYKLIPAAN